jgi:membrane-associated phospholipid phosphatase
VAELTQRAGSARIELGREPLTVAVIVRFALAAAAFVVSGILVGRALVAVTPVPVEVSLLRGIVGQDDGLSGLLGRTASGLGNFWFVSALALGVAATSWAATRRWDTAWLIVLTLFGSLGVTGSIKLGVGRDRPDEALVGTLSTAFPSGHAVRSIAVYGLAVWVLARLGARLVVKVIGVALLVAAVVAIGFSRMYLGAHWPTDIGLGYLIGALWLMVVLRTARPRIVTDGPEGRTAR